MKIFRKLKNILGFLWHYLIMIIRSNLMVAHDVLAIRYEMKPAIICILLEVRTDIEIFMLTNLITMTPGTLSLDISDDKRKLFIHVMYAKEAEDSHKEIKELEKWITKLLGNDH